MGLHWILRNSASIAKWGRDEETDFGGSSGETAKSLIEQLLRHTADTRVTPPLVAAPSAGCLVACGVVPDVPGHDGAL
jgi:hypothetical protein